MKIIIIQGKTVSVNRAKSVINKVYKGKNSVKFKRGNVSCYFEDGIYEEDVLKIMSRLKLRITYASSVRIIMEPR